MYFTLVPMLNVDSSCERLAMFVMQYTLFNRINVMQCLQYDAMIAMDCKLVLCNQRYLHHNLLKSIANIALY